VPLEHFFTPPARRRPGIVRNHPLLVATTAASAGVVLGAYVAVQLLVTTPTKNDDAARQTVQAAAESKTVQTATESKAVRAETTGQAPSGDRDGTTTDCSRQTWPYLSRDCMELNKSAPRVVSTDKLDQPTVKAIENPPTPERTGPLPQASANASAVTTPPPAAAAATAPSAAPGVTAATTVPTAAPAQGGVDQAAAGDLAPPKVTKTKHAKKPKQRSKPDDRTLAKAEDDDQALAKADDNDDAPVSRESREERRTLSSPDRSRRVGERWTGREEYDVPSSDGRGQRRVTVIRRNGGGSVERFEGNGLFERRESGGPFGGLFGFR
jgi:hypothetical protein